jgi:carbonic anhydrase/acetyltransferase-like protein (isoleucine patch superfamily)
MPEISRSAWIFKTAVIVGNAVIGDNVFVAPNAVIRADEPG